jgi:hypothetical protein
MRHCFLLALWLLPAVTLAQTPVAKHKDGSVWLVYVASIYVSEPQQNGDRIVSVLVEKRDAQGASVERARQFTTGCYVHGDGKTRWGNSGAEDEWTWGGPLILDIIATRSCQYAWDRVEPEPGVAMTNPWPSNVR